MTDPKPVLWVPRAIDDSEHWIAGEFGVQNVEEKPFVCIAGWECLPLYDRAALDAAVAAERASRQAAQAQVERLQSELARSGVEMRREVAAERERCAKVCEDWGATHQPHETVNAQNMSRKLAAAIRAEQKE